MSSFVGSFMVDIDATAGDMKGMLQTHGGGSISSYNNNNASHTCKFTSNLSSDQYEKLIYLLNNTQIGKSSACRSCS